MTTLRRIVLVLSLLLAVLPAAAYAAEPPEILTDLSIAYASDPDAPCAGRVEIDWTEDVRAEAIAEASGVYERPDGEWYLTSCTISARPELWNLSKDQRCRIIVHEVKHLAMHRHEEGGVMSSPVGPYAPCEAAWPAPAVAAPASSLFEEAAVAIRRTLPAGNWLISCGKRRGSTLPCRAEKGEWQHPTTRRYAVRLGPDRRVVRVQRRAPVRR